MRPELIQRVAEHAVVRQVLRFAVVGMTATAVHYAILVGLVELASVRPVLATSCGYVVGTIVSFTLNRRFTFEARTPVASSFVKFALLYAIGALLNGWVVAILIQAGLYYLLAQIAATALVLIWNFAGARYVVFRVKPDAETQPRS